MDSPFLVLLHKQALIFFQNFKVFRAKPHVLHGYDVSFIEHKLEHVTII